ncbi:MAG: hypothetical protein ACREBU_00445 [Nitrososphaera sp.]
MVRPGMDTVVRWGDLFKGLPLLLTCGASAVAATAFVAELAVTVDKHEKTLERLNNTVQNLDVIDYRLTLVQTRLEDLIETLRQDPRLDPELTLEEAETRRKENTKKKERPR